jgi:hypothetical protein
VSRRSPYGSCVSPVVVVESEKVEAGEDRWRGHGQEVIDASSLLGYGPLGFRTNAPSIIEPGGNSSMISRARVHGRPPPTWCCGNVVRERLRDGLIAREQLGRNVCYSPNSGHWN